MGAVGGMVSGVVLGVMIIPVLFIVFQLLHEKVSGPYKKFNLEEQTLLHVA